jgi:hypothetical protein
MNKPLDSCLELLFLLSPPFDLSQTLNGLNLGGVKYPLKNLASSGLLQGSYTC